MPHRNAEFNIFIPRAYIKISLYDAVKTHTNLIITMLEKMLCVQFCTTLIVNLLKTVTLYRESKNCKDTCSLLEKTSNSL